MRKNRNKGGLETVKVIVGLGNPGKEYEKTRHNVGFHVVDLVAEVEDWKWDGKLGKTPLAAGLVNGEKVVLATIAWQPLPGQVGPGSRGIGR